MKRYRHATALTVAALVLTSCGARLTEEQQAFGVAAAGGGGGNLAVDPSTGEVVTGDGGTGTVADPSGGATEGSTGAVSGGTSGGTTGAASGGTSGGTAGDTTGATSGGTSGGASGGTSGGTTGGTTDTRSAPAGGNGGATDVGVTEDTIKIVNVADVGGALPGLFEDARLATIAFFTYFASTEGTVYGRQIEVQAKDSAIDDGQNRTHYVDACENAFAAVGSMSANDGGAAPPIKECGIPDVRTAAVNESIQLVDSVYGMDAMKPGLLPVSEYNFWKEQHPEAVKNGGYLYIDNATTKYQGEQNRAGTEKIGYTWVYVKAIGLAETNYSTVVLEMKEAGVQFVTIQGSTTNAVRLADAMKQQNFEPVVYALQTNLYTPDLITQGKGNIEGAQVAVTGSLVEEIAASPEMQLYAEWLKRVKPDARPTGLGMYAWSASRMFVDTLKAVGPDLTRQRFLTELKKVRGYSNNGLIPPQDVGTKTPADCIIIVEVSGGAFKRVEPASGTGFRCDNQVVSTR